MALLGKIRAWHCPTENASSPVGVILLWSAGQSTCWTRTTGSLILFAAGGAPPVAPLIVLPQPKIDRSVIDRLNQIAALYDEIAAGQHPGPTDRA